MVSVRQVVWTAMILRIIDLKNVLDGGLEIGAAAEHRGPSVNELVEAMIGSRKWRVRCMR